MYQNIETQAIVQDQDAVVGPDGTSYPCNWDKSALPFLRNVTETPKPDDATLVVTGWRVVDGFKVWDTRPKTADELSIDKKTAVLIQIATLEVSITVRRWREASPDDAGGTPDGRTWLKNVADQIAALRAGL